MKRKLLSILLTLCMMLTLLPTMALAAGPTYDDTEGHWAEEAIERWSDYGIIQGSNGSFDPNGPLTRGQMAVILCRLLDLPEAPSAGFTDVDKDAWYADAIDRCAAAGIMLGSDGKAMPEATITREQAMVMLCRALGIEPIENPDLSAYADADQVSDWAAGYVAALIEAGIVNGVTDNTLAPQDDINRASTVTILDRAIAVYAAEDGATVDAAGVEGLILIVGENVTVKNAPAGTVIIVADGASGLTVNGKKVADDQTYTVPEKTTGSSSGSSSGGSSHSHSYDTANWTYDDTYHWHAATCGHSTVSAKAEHECTSYIANGNGTHSGTCSVCGAALTKDCDYVSTTENGTTTYTCSVCDDTYTVAEGVTEVVARIDNTGYATLADAIDAAESDATITMLADVTNAEGMSVESGKKFTIDFDGHTYTVNKPGAGSNNTETAGFQLKKDSTITFKNGTINVSSDNLTAATTGKNIKHLFQNYANLTLDTMIVDGTNLYNDGQIYTVSNCYGDIKIKNSTITAPDGGVAFDVYSWPNGSYGDVTVTVTSSTINGKIELDSDNNATKYNSLVIESGTFNGALAVKSAKSVTIKSGSFTDINTALKYTADNATITILKSTSENITTVPAGNNVTITAAEGVVLSGKIGGSYWNKSTTFDGLKFSGSDSLGISLNANADNISYTIQYCTFEGVTANSVKQGVISINGKPVDVTVKENIITDVQNYTGPNGSNSKDESEGIHVTGATGTITVKDNKISNVTGTGIYVNVSGTVSITGNTVSGWGGGGASNNAGRAIRTDNGSSVTITGNKLMAPTVTHEQYIKSTNCTTLTVSGNYWGGNDPTADGIFAADNGVEKIFVLKDYYTDEAMTNLVSFGVALNEAGEYLISNAAGLKWLNDFMKAGTNMGSAYDNLSGKTFKLADNIDAAGVTWTTVTLSAEQNTPGFTFDGNGKTISNLTVSGKGMFCTWANGRNSDQPTTIQNITFDKATVTEATNGNGYHIGLIWGELAGDLVLSNVNVTKSSITGKCNVGALVGRNSGDEPATLKFNGCSVIDCTITATGSGDPNGASAFLGSALTNGHAFTLTFEGTNTQSGNTMSSATNQVGGGVYATWVVSTNETSVVDGFNSLTIS